MFLCGWNGKIIADSSCIFHEYPNIDPAENVLELLTDADWASDKKKHDVQCLVLRWLLALLFFKSHKIAALPSADSETYSCFSGASDAFLLSQLISWMTGKRTHIVLYTGSSGARGILQRQGVGRFFCAGFYGCRTPEKFSPQWCLYGLTFNSIYIRFPFEFTLPKKV
jgi:hypothetical protein